jgi:Ca2+-transporting ATPase
LLFSFACRSSRRTLPELGLLTNPHLLTAIAVSGLMQFGVVMLPIAQGVFEVGSSPGWDWLVVLGLALVPVSVVEISKLVLAAVNRLKPVM